MNTGQRFSDHQRPFLRSLTVRLLKLSSTWYISYSPRGAVWK